jgi:two-component system sensor histidine kinase TctE
LRSPTPASQNPLSLLVEILDWLLAPLIVLWPLTVVVTFWIANAVSNIPYDRALADSVNALARHVGFASNRSAITLPAAASSFLRTDELDTIYFQVRGTRGEVLAGDRELSEIFPDEGQSQHIVYYRDAEWHGDPVRVAYMFLFEPDAPHRRVVIQVGETLNKRQKLSNEIIAGIIVPQFFLFPVVALLAWFGLTRGTQPLERLRERLRVRATNDLTPIDVHEVPDEVAPLVETFNALMARLAVTMRAQERFIADAAHQMRTPLAGLRTQLEFALRQKDPGDLRASLERIRSSVERATRMLSQLLSLARSQSEAPPKFEAVDMNALAREVTQEWVEQALAKRIDLGFEAAAEPALVEGSRLLLHELLTNLVDNAVRYTAPGGRVTARVTARDFVVVEIEDNGIGISESDRELIFERFYRVTGHEATGTGLGLPIVRSIASQHGASVQVRPNPAERGSVFTVIFPRLAELPWDKAA